MKETPRLTVIICALAVLILGGAVLRFVTGENTTQSLIGIGVGVVILIYAIVRLVILKKNGKSDK